MLLNVLVQIANKMGFKKIISNPKTEILEQDRTDSGKSNNSFLTPVFVERKAFAEQLPRNDRRGGGRRIRIFKKRTYT
jgi:hypothetical protein